MRLRSLLLSALSQDWKDRLPGGDNVSDKSSHLKSWVRVIPGECSAGLHFTAKTMTWINELRADGRVGTDELSIEFTRANAFANYLLLIWGSFRPQTSWQQLGRAGIFACQKNPVKILQLLQSLVLNLLTFLCANMWIWLILHWLDSSRWTGRAADL